MDLSSLRERGAPDAFSVSELNNYIKNVFEGDRVLSALTVKGEISNFTNHRSGHLYFSLKDAEGQIRAVMFRSHAARLKFLPESGMKVILHGSVTVYPRDGSYQIYVSSMQPDGIGALYLAYEQLKGKLAAEGLFDEEHKKAIPYIPTRIGVITSPTGAAVRDIINVTGRRFPYAKIYLYPTLVQGADAEADLIRAVDYFDRSALVDVVIIGRGGGSIEDLWAFNGEALARRIYSANVPIISAVGHETDFTICDFVSDMRAPTPSAAAEIAVPDTRELLHRFDALMERSVKALVRYTERARERLSRYGDVCTADNFERMIAPKKDEVLFAFEKAREYAGRILTNGRHRLAVNSEKLVAMNPLTVLSRGYAIVEKNGKVIIDGKAVKVGDEILVRLSKGRISAVVSDVES